VGGWDVIRRERHMRLYRHPASEQCREVVDVFRRCMLRQRREYLSAGRIIVFVTEQRNVLTAFIDVKRIANMVPLRRSVQQVDRQSDHATLRCRKRSDARAELSNLLKLFIRSRDPSKKRRRGCARGIGWIEGVPRIVPGSGGLQLGDARVPQRLNAELAPAPLTS